MILLMSGTFITIQESAELSGKSIQTIRRALKAKKLEHKKKKTPQGYNYMVDRESVISVYKLRIAKMDRQQGGIKSKKNTDMANEFATLNDLKNIQTEMQELIVEHQKASESLKRFIKAFQERFMVLENQMKLIESPDQKRWYQFWK